MNDSMEYVVRGLIQALELIAVGDVSGDRAKDFAVSVLVELGIWEEEND